MKKLTNADLVTQIEGLRARVEQLTRDLADARTVAAPAKPKYVAKPFARTPAQEAARTKAIATGKSVAVLS